VLPRQQLEAWYAAYGFAVHRRCARLLGSDAEAGDAVHEVFLRAWEHGDSVRDASTPLGWLYRVADRHCFDVLDTRRRRSVDRLPPAPDEVSSGVDWETSRLLSQVLEACSDRVRQVAIAYYVDGLTQDETAAQLGISRKTVKEKLAQFRELGARLLEVRPIGGAP
jgi:RNA polymerase sigma-70 factor (ECF subfamily)